MKALITLLSTICGFCFLYYFLYHTHDVIHDANWILPSLKYQTPSENKTTVATPFPNLTILFWGDCFKGFFPEEWNNRIIQGVQVTNNREKLSRSNFIFLHKRCLGDLPSIRYTWQYWVLHILESPVNEAFTLEFCTKFDGVFNLTSNYSPLADIEIKYGECREKTTGSPAAERLPSPERLNKTHLVAWAASNCQSQSEREKLVAKLKTHIPIDVYGECGESQPPRETFPSILKRYKFYLSFENSLCSDYVTEKLYYTVSMPDTYVIPIVLGAGPYINILPEHSLIDIHDFSSTKDLAKHLLSIDQNDTAFMEYFAWKRSHTCQFNHNFLYQEITAAAKQVYGKQSVVNSTDISKVFSLDHCISAGDYYSNFTFI